MCDTTSKRCGPLHLAEFVGEEEQLAIARSCDEAAFRLISVVHDEARVAHSRLPAHPVEVGLPTLAIRRIRQHEVELMRREAVGGERRVVLFTTVVSRPRSLTFLNDRVNLMNVAVSRAREQLLIIGAPDVLLQGQFTRLLVERAVRTG